jgi:hypothetical protein
VRVLYDQQGRALESGDVKPCVDFWVSVLDSETIVGCRNPVVLQAYEQVPVASTLLVEI